jgi:hypothetical protein
VEVKTGKSELSENQLSTSKRIRIPFVICRIPYVDVVPKDVKIHWSTVEQDFKILDEI